MAENTQETIKNLYALRAGLSLASEKMDEVKEVESDLRAEAKENEEIIKSKNATIRQNEENCKKIKASYERKNGEIESSRKKIEEFDKKISELRKDGEKRKMWFCLKICFSILLATFVILCFSMCMNSCDAQTFSDEQDFYSWMSVVFFVLSIGGGFVCIYSWCKDERICYNEEEALKLEKEKEKLIDLANSKIASEQDVLNDEEYQQSISTIEDEKVKIADLDAEIVIREKTAQGKVLAYSKEGEAIYNSLIPVFSKVLDVRDWGNVDLVIFLLETGRAETMKEALQQVDGYRHTDRIVHAINDASRAISNSISRGIAHLERTIQQSAVMITSQLVEIRKNQNYIENEMVASNEKLLGLIDATKMQSALLEKANVSSEQLVGDISRMRQLADEAYFMNYKNWYK